MRSQLRILLDCCAYKRRCPFTVRTSPSRHNMTYDVIPLFSKLPSLASHLSAHVLYPPTFVQCGLQVARPTPSSSPMGLKVEENFRRVAPTAPVPCPLRWSPLMKPLS